MQSHRTCRRSSRSFAIGIDPVAGLLNLATVLAAWICALVHIGARNPHSKIGDRDDGGMESRGMTFVGDRILPNHLSRARTQLFCFLPTTLTKN
jgi:hypothetical protein